jgi:hypothetical protein
VTTGWPDSRTALWKPGSKNGARRREFYEDRGVRFSIMAGGSSSRPDTLKQTEQRPISTNPLSRLMAGIRGEVVRGWIGAVGAKTAYIEQGSSWVNDFIENARVRNELLDGENLPFACRGQDRHRELAASHNTERPHGSGVTNRRHPRSSSPPSPRGRFATPPSALE